MIDQRTAEELELIARVEKIKGRKLTPQEANLVVAQARAIGNID